MITLVNIIIVVTRSSKDIHVMCMLNNLSLLKNSMGSPTFFYLGWWSRAWSQMRTTAVAIRLQHGFSTFLLSCTLLVYPPSPVYPNIYISLYILYIFCCYRSGFYVPLEMVDCTPGGTCTPGWEALVYTMEKIIIASIWVHDCAGDGISLEGIRARFSQRFDKPAPKRDTLYSWEKKAFSTGRVLDA